MEKMILETQEYTWVDVLRLPFKITPFLVLLQLLLALVQAIMPTAVMALATAFFVDTAIGIFSDGADLSRIYLPIAILLFVVGVNSVLGNLPGLVGSRIKFALERVLLPAVLDVQASLAYKHIEDAESWELIDRVSEELVETLQEGVAACGIMLRNIVAIISILGLVVAQVWWAALIIFIVSVPLFWIAFIAGKKNYEAEVETRKYERRYSYYTEVLTGRAAVEERTLFGYADLVLCCHLNSTALTFRGVNGND